VAKQQVPEGGRSLSKSVLYGSLLGAAFLLSILIVRELFLVLVGTAIAFAVWELSSALRLKGWYVPRVPASIGAALIIPATYYWGVVGQWGFTLVTSVALMGWRLVHILWEKRRSVSQTFGATIKDLAASAFVVTYLPLTISFSVLLLKREQDGPAWVMSFVIPVALIDTFGYLVGRKLGKHKMAPGVSPKKTWEGLLASVIAGVVSTTLLITFLVGIEWWYGVILAGLLILAAVFGDLAESLIKRDLGVKDMSSLLPGHGGIMDRLDSILPAALVTYVFVTVFGF
jgi:phosphatidate cytidylyltransferase